MGNRTFTIIKPNAVVRNNTGKIVAMLETEGFVIKALKMIFLSRNDASKFYAVHKDKPFWDELIEFMTSGPIVAAILEREDAVAHLRELAGATDPAKAGEGTIRRLYGESLTRNAIHASDSDENARLEWEKIFREEDIIDV